MQNSSSTLNVESSTSSMFSSVTCTIPSTMGNYAIMSPFRRNIAETLLSESYREQDAKSKERLHE